MLPISENARRWEPIAQAELDLHKCPLPVDLVLALIDRESSGIPGLVNAQSGAMGLGQVMPIVVRDYNAVTGDNISHADLKGKTDTDAEKQIRISVWVLLRFWRSAHRYLTRRNPNHNPDDLARIADLFYVAGPGATQKKLNALASPTWAAIQDRYPDWNALPHPRFVFARTDTAAWPWTEIYAWLGSHPSKYHPPGRSPIDGVILASILIAIALWALKKWGKNGKEKTTNHREAPQT